MSVSVGSSSFSWASISISSPSLQKNSKVYYCCLQGWPMLLLLFELLMNCARGSGTCLIVIYSFQSFNLQLKCLLLLCSRNILILFVGFLFLLSWGLTNMQFGGLLLQSYSFLFGYWLISCKLSTVVNSDCLLFPMTHSISLSHEFIFIVILGSDWYEFMILELF